MDPSKLRATDYKYNRYLTLPRSSDAQTEALHEIRKKELLGVFDSVSDPEMTKKEPESNLSLAERRGLKSLQKRVAAGEIIITETDKSK